MDFTPALNLGIENLRQQLAQKGINATGATSEQLRIGSDGLSIVGKPSTYYVIFGRKPITGNPPYSPEFTDNLLNWVSVKLGLNGKEATRAMWAIRNKINQEGTDIFQKKRKGLDVDQTAEVVSAEILKTLSDVVISKIKQNGNSNS